jgi:hypothetical protein
LAAVSNRSADGIDIRIRNQKIWVCALFGERVVPVELYFAGSRFQVNPFTVPNTLLVRRKRASDRQPLRLNSSVF